MPYKPYTPSPYLMDGLNRTPARDTNKTKFSLDYVDTRLNTVKEEEQKRQAKQSEARDGYYPSSGSPKKRSSKSPRK